MKISDYDYTLPDERIAQFPPKIRGKSRLLVLNKRSGTVTHRNYEDLAEYLKPGDVMVLNDTKVIKARLIAKNSEGRERELLLIEEHGDRMSHNIRKAIYRGKLHVGETLTVQKTKIVVKNVLDGGITEIESSEDLLQLTEKVGSVPLPPYMKRNATSTDTERYQTVFARKTGSVAAPTASLNFTEELKQKIESKGIKIVYLTLHVGLGTFMPIRSDDVEDHKMHSEYFEIPTETIEAIQEAKKHGKRVCAVGTTVTRTLEYAQKDILEQPAHNLSGEADIFMYPGYEFSVVDMLLTNFHAPRTTVLMLAAAFADWKNLKGAYDEAVTQEYNFLSYGDSMLIY